MKNWFKKTGIKAIKTTCQTAVALIPAGVMIKDVDWVVILSTSLLSGFVCILTNIANIKE